MSPVIPQEQAPQTSDLAVTLGGVHLSPQTPALWTWRLFSAGRRASPEDVDSQQDQLSHRGGRWATCLLRFSESPAGVRPCVLVPEVPACTSYGIEGAGTA